MSWRYQGGEFVLRQCYASTDGSQEHIQRQAPLWQPRFLANIARLDPNATTARGSPHTQGTIYLIAFDRAHSLAFQDNHKIHHIGARRPARKQPSHTSKI